MCKLIKLATASSLVAFSSVAFAQAIQPALPAAAVITGVGTAQSAVTGPVALTSISGQTNTSATLVGNNAAVAGTITDTIVTAPPLMTNTLTTTTVAP